MFTNTFKLIRQACLISLLLLSLVCTALAAERFGTGYQRFTAKACAWCGTTKKLQVHHIITELEIRESLQAGEITQEQAEHLANHDETNTITLCQPCHFVLGHKCNWHKENPNILIMINTGKGDPSVAQPNTSKGDTHVALLKESK